MPYPVDNLQVVMFLCYLTNVALSALLVGTGRPFPGAWLWVVGQGLLAVGTLFDALPPTVPPWLPLVVGNTCYTAAALFFAHSVWVFRWRTPFPWPAYAVIAAQLLSFVVVLDSPYWVRAFVFSTWMTLGPLTTGTLLVWAVSRPNRLSHWLTAFPFFVLGVASLLRDVILGTLALADRTSLLPAVNVWYVSGAILLGTIILFGYFTMTRAREEEILAEKDEEIEARNRKLVESVRAKDLFFSIIAHDLRGPIGGSARYVRKHLLGKMTGLEAKYSEVETLASALEKTNEFLEKLLWWSRAQLQDWIPDRRSIDLERILGQCRELIGSAAEMKELTIEWPQGPFPQPVADPESVQLILGNLLSNAVKFSLPGRTVRVTVACDDLLCRIAVADEGVGMDPATLDRLFRIEDKLTSHGTSGERGSGLGLILAQSLAERNSGGITIDSVPGKGTTATLWLPKQYP